MGIAHRILPRFRGAEDAPAPMVVLSFALLVGGLLLRLAQLWPEAPARGALLLASATAVLLGMLLYARLALRVLASGDNAHRADELFLAMGAAFGVVGAMWNVVALAPAIAGAPVVDPDAERAAVAALLLGFVAAHVIGVSLRVAPAFVAAPPPRDRLVIGAAAAWAIGVAVTTIGGPVAPVLLLAAAVVVARSVVPVGRGIAVRPVPAHARVTRLAFRGAYAWLVIGLALLAAAATGAPLGAAALHALGLGFLTQIVFGVGARLIPATTGGLALSLGPVRAALVLVNVAAGIRVAFEIVGPATTVASLLLASSGPLALAALLVFAGAAARSVRSALFA